jgi:hypothetical protein
MKKRREMDSQRFQWIGSLLLIRIGHLAGDATTITKSD